jgi:hypothetical protein
MIDNPTVVKRLEFRREIGPAGKSAPEFVEDIWAMAFYTNVHFNLVHAVDEIIQW